MRFIIILITLGLERFLGVSPKLRNFSWFDTYVGYVSPFVAKLTIKISWLSFVALLAPVLIIVSILSGILNQVFYGSLGPLFGLLVLVACIGPSNLFTDLSDYLNAMEASDTETAAEAAKSLAFEGDSSPHGVTKGVFVKANRRLFSVIFWFAFLGPMGALMYRLVMVTRDFAREGKPQFVNLEQPSFFILNILDWAPVRLVGIVYALVGNFIAGFGSWCRHCLAGLSRNNEVMANYGIAALGEDINSTTGTHKETQSALQLIERGLIVYIVLVLILTLIAW